MAASGFIDLGFAVAGSKTVVENFESISYRRVTVPPATSSVSSVQVTLIPALPTPPFVNQATVALTAAAPARATLASVAQVRAAQGDAGSSSSSLVIDFQAQRTVSELDGPVAIHSVAPWLGTKFDDPVTGLDGKDSTAVTFPELQTERLLVQLGSAASPATFAAQGAVVIPTPPSNLELLVGGTRVWFNAGPAVGAGGGAFAQTVDVTDAVFAAASAGQLPVVVTLRASVPGLLTLTGSADLLQRYPVAFPEGVAWVVDAPSEGVYPLSLPISAASIAPDTGVDWQVERVVLDVSAKIPQTRVLPADGPELSGDAELVLDQDHAFVVRLPPADTGRLAVLSGVRLPVSVGTDGAELAGTLRGGTATAPGDPLPKGQLGPVTLQPPAGPSSGPTWIDLTLTTPLKLADSAVVWLELQAARGTVVWSLAEPQADPDGDALLRRRTSSGTYVALSTVTGVPTYAGALRVVGQGKPNEPLPAVVAAVAGDTTSKPVAAVPTPDGTTIVLGLSAPAATAAVAGGSDRELPLELTISTPGSYAVTSAELQYKLSTSEA